MTLSPLTRRHALLSALGLGISVDFMGERAFADVEGARARKRLVVIICRGGLDGLSLSPPVGDHAYAGLRGAIALPHFGEAGGALKLDETFGLHPAMAATHALALKGEARIAPAVATPDRERSHFEAQDVLESGAAVVYSTSSGWLNRALSAMGPAGAIKAISMGPTAPLILRGPVEAASWSPGGGAQIDHRLPGILADLYAHDPLLGLALASGMATQAMAKVAQTDVNMADASRETGVPAMADPGADKAANPQRGGRPLAHRLGATLAAFMTQPGGQQVAAVSIDGFDSHANQLGLVNTRLTYVDGFIEGLASGLGDDWRDTVVVMATEFGRTARANGTGGTDHGTASTALVLGGAIKKGGIIGDWPTLAQARLFENRDTAPTMDMRALFKGVLRDHMGVERAALDAAVFPGSAAVAPAEGIVA